uniref:Ig-like domain-containing protein n=1 Tax=Panthera leo TaxID=9689 RepID=A0A8C8Y2Z9_PANLE
MAWTPFLLTVLALCSGSWAQPTLTQEASMSGSVGQKVTLTCTGNSNNVGSYYVGVSWYQKLPGRGASKLVISNSTARPSGVPARFLGSRSRNMASLSIAGLQAEDEADYYWSVWDKSLNAHTELQAWRK